MDMRAYLYQYNLYAYKLYIVIAFSDDIRLNDCTLTTDGGYNVSTTHGYIEMHQTYTFTMPWDNVTFSYWVNGGNSGFVPV